MKISKNLKAAYSTFDKEKAHSTKEAIALMIKNSKVKFDPTCEIHFTLDIDPKQADQQIRSTTSLPHGTGKTVKVAVVCGDDLQKAAKAAGAVEVGSEELVEKIIQGWTDFDVLVASPDMMRVLAKAARILGPKGLMPNPKSGTVTPDIEKAVTELVGGRIEFRNDKFGIVHSIFGKLSFGDKKLLENLEFLIKTLKDAKPTGVKGVYIKNITINSTMGAGIKIETGESEEV